MKPCNKCKKQKPLHEFYPNVAMQDGTMPTCKICFSKYRPRYQKELLKLAEIDQGSMNPHSVAMFHDVFSRFGNNINI